MSLNPGAPRPVTAITPITRAVEYTRPTARVVRIETLDGEPDVVLQPVDVHCLTQVNMVVLHHTPARCTIRLKGVQGVRGGPDTWNGPTKNRPRGPVWWAK